MIGFEITSPEGLLVGCMLVMSEKHSVSKNRTGREVIAGTSRCESDAQKSGSINGEL